jgi:hypothetical protein
MGHDVFGSIHRQICEPKIVTYQTSYCELFEFSRIKPVNAARHRDGSVEVCIESGAGPIGADLTGVISDRTDRPFSELLRRGQVCMKYITSLLSNNLRISTAQVIERK